MPTLRVVDTENKRLITLTGKRTELENLHSADFVVLGGGLGGIAAALSICLSGRTAILVEETDRIAGCFAVPDTTLYTENRFVETSGTSLSYQTFRTKIREWYRKNAQAPPTLSNTIFSNIGDFTSDSFCFEGEAALDVIQEMLEKSIGNGRLTILKRHKVAKVITYNNRITSLEAVDMDNLIANQISGWMYIDATRTGYILPLAGVEHVVGSESNADTDEPNAADIPDTLGVQDFLYCSGPLPSVENKDGEEIYITELFSDPEQVNSETLSFPIMQEPRRIKALTRIVEQDISAEFQKGARAKFFRDSIGIGYSPILISSEDVESDTMALQTVPFQIPLGALIPLRVTNFLAGGGTLGATNIAASAYQAPSVEWAIGEAAGETAAYCAGKKINSTHDLFKSREHVRGLQEWLVTKRKAPVYWYDDVTTDDPDFAEAQLKPFGDAEYHTTSTTLHYRQ
ncbi:MAG: FAD-dependent oxidoreductase [Candidatus Latescibacteria bacterium]|nr:FAD-dependent oxidoreductase [Candidatus Latescibacterota bacterium]